MKKDHPVKTTNFFLKWFATAALVIAGVTHVHAQADTAMLESLTLKDLLNVKVTTASKTLQELGLAPATVIVIPKEQIRMRGYQSLLDLLYDLPDIKVDDKIYSGIRNSITVRGTQGSEKMVILMDGITISSPSGEAMPVMENYPVNIAEQVEIVYGPASALYGANAVTGVINIITKTPEKKDFSLEASTAVGSGGYTNTSVFMTKKVNDKMHLILSGQYAYDHGVDYSKLYKADSLLDVTSNTNGLFHTIYGPVTPSAPTHSGYEAPMSAYNIYAALHTPAFTFSVFRNYTRIPTAFGSNTSNALYNKEAFMGQSVTVANASYKKSLKRTNIMTLLSASEYDMDPHSNYRNLYTSMEPAYKYSTCSMVKAEEQLDYKASGKLNFSIGAGYENYNAVPQSTDLDAPVDKNDHIHGSYLGTNAFYRPGGLPAQFYFIRYHNAGSYFQMQYVPVDKLHVTAGIRYDINSRYGNSFNPRLGFVYSPSRKTTFKAMYGSAFLAPSPSDSYSQYGSFDTQDSGRTYHSYFLHLPNPGLKPIHSYNAELSLQHYFNYNLYVTLNAYYSFLKGLHKFSDDNETTHLYNNSFNGIPVDYIEVFTNNARQQNYGGSMNLNLKTAIGKLNFNSYASLSIVSGRVEDGNKESVETKKDARLDFIAPFIFRIGTDVKAGKFSFAPRMTVMGRQSLPGYGDTLGHIIKRQVIDGYALLNITLGYNPSKKIAFFSNITNALNQHYRAVGFNMDLTKKDTDLFYGQPEDPIRINVGVNFNF